MSRHQSPFFTSGPKRAILSKSLPPGELIPLPWTVVIR